MYYPEFNLKKNPFAHSEWAEERHTRYERVETEAIQLIKQQIGSEVTTIFEGPRGCGKSTALEMTQGEANFTVISPFTLVDLLNSLECLVKRNYLEEMSGIVNEEGKTPYHDFLEKNIRIEPNWLKSILSTYPNRQGLTYERIICDYPDCFKKHRCELYNESRLDSSDKRRQFPRISKIDFLEMAESLCPLREWLLVEIFDVIYRNERYDAEDENKELERWVFLLDVPDVRERKMITSLNKFILKLRRATGSVIILMATREQYREMQRSEGFNRLVREDFPLMEKPQLIEVVEKRVKSLTEGDVKMPFDDNSLNYLAESSGGNPRILLKKCSRLLGRMKSEGRTTASDFRYVSNVMGRDATISIADGIEAVIKDLLREQGQGWVEGKVIKRNLREKYGLDVDSRTIGRMIGPDSKYRFDKRKSPTAEYWVR